LSRARSALAAMPADASFEDLYVFSFKGSQGGVKQLPLRHDDDVEGWRDLVATENLSNQSFSSIPLDGATQLLRGRDPQPAHGLACRQQEEREQAPVNARALLVYTQKLGTAPNPFFRPEASHARRQTLRRPLLFFAADRQALATLGAAALQDETPVLGGHPHEKTVRACAVARIWLKRSLTLHADPFDEERTANDSGRFRRVSTRVVCVRVSVLHETSRPRKIRCAFGLSPKFSTPVEKTVEIKAPYGESLSNLVA
jgi:hypothetical protein